MEHVDPDSERLPVQGGQGRSGEEAEHAAVTVTLCIVGGLVLIVGAYLYHIWFAAPPVKAEVVPLPW